MGAKVRNGGAWGDEKRAAAEQDARAVEICGRGFREVVALGERCAVAGSWCWRRSLTLAGRARGRSPLTPAAAGARRCPHAGSGDGASCAVRAKYVPGSE